jgi:membrane associated rhomboid family serine protease
MPAIPMPAWMVVAGYVAIELYLSVTGMQEGLSHCAHSRGMIHTLLVFGNSHTRQRWRSNVQRATRSLIAVPAGDDAA